MTSSRTTKMPSRIPPTRDKARLCRLQVIKLVVPFSAAGSSLPPHGTVSGRILTGDGNMETCLWSPVFPIHWLLSVIPCFASRSVLFLQERHHTSRRVPGSSQGLRQARKDFVPPGSLTMAGKRCNELVLGVVPVAGF